MTEGFISIQILNDPLSHWMLGGFILWNIFFYLLVMKYLEREVRRSKQEKEKMGRVDKLFSFFFVGVDWYIRQGDRVLEWVMRRF